MNRTLIYARVSTEDQLEKYGLPSQLRACREFALAQSFAPVVEEITDDGVSGTILDRPGLSRVRQLVAEGAVDVVLMFDTDRLSRELVHLLILKPEIEKRAKLEFVAGRFEDSPSGRLFYSLKGAIGQYEREVIRERTTRGKKERARAGLIVGGRVAYGYRYEAGRLIPDETRAPIVRDIFSWYDGGVSNRSIALRLRETGAPTWSGRKWGNSSVRRILINETYSGVAHYGTHRREGKLLRLREPAERIALAVPSLVSREQWERVQARMAPKSQVGRPSSNYLLRGLLHCTCGRRMSGERSRKNHAYRCTGRDALRFHGEICRRQVGVSLLDAAVWASIAEAFTDSDYLRDILSEHRSELQVLGPERFEALDRQLRRLKAKEQTCLSALLDPDLAGSRDAIKSTYRQAHQERQRAENEIAGLAASRSQAASAHEWLEETVTLLREYIPTLTAPEVRQELVRRLVTRAEWDGGELVHLSCFLSPEIFTTSRRCENFQPLQVVLTARLAA